MRGFYERKEAIWIIFWIIVYSLLTLIGFSRSLWIDEFATLIHASNGLEGVLLDPGHPPGYYVILLPLVVLFGESEWVIRFPSLIFGIGVIFVSYHLAREIFPDHRVSFIVIPLLAVNPYLIRLGNEARVYTMLPFMILIVTYLYILTRKTQQINNRKLWLGLILSGVLLAYIHYYGVVFLAALFVFGCFQNLFEYIRKKNLQPLKELVLAYIFMGLLILPLVPFALSQFSTLAVSNVDRLLKPQQILFIPVNFFMPTAQIDYSLDMTSILFVAGWSSPFLLLALIGLIKILKGRPTTSMALYIVLLYTTYFIANYLVHFTGLWFFNIRYILYLLPLSMMLIAYGVCGMIDQLSPFFESSSRRLEYLGKRIGVRISARRIEWAGVLIIGLVLFSYAYLPRIILESDSSYVYSTSGGVEDHRKAMEYILESSNSSMLAIVDPAYTQYVLEYYTPVTENAPRFLGILFNATTTVFVYNQLQVEVTLWYIWSYAYSADQEGQVLSWLEAQGYLKSTEYFGKLVVVLVAL